MSIKILGGLLQGLKVKTLNVPELKPTSVILRRKFFDTFQDWEDIAFVDLYAGSGAMGIEALSRGVGELWLNEKNMALYRNLSLVKTELTFKLSETYLHEIKVTNLEAKKALRQLESYSNQIQASCLCLFIDPPYGEIEEYIYTENFLNGFAKGKNKDIFIVMEGDDKGGFTSERLGLAQPEAEFIYHGDHYLGYYRLKPN